jgi:hypothetical protein
VILVLGRWKQEDHKFEAHLAYLMRSCLKNKTHWFELHCLPAVWPLAHCAKIEITLPHEVVKEIGWEDVQKA